MAKRKLTKLERVGIVAVIVIMASFFYDREVYKPEHEKFKLLRENFIELSAEVRDLKRQEPREGFISAISERDKELRQARSELEEASQVLAGAEDLMPILTQIGQLAGKHNLKIGKFSPVEGKRLRNEEEVSPPRSFHKMALRGNFLDFREFLREVKLLPKLVVIERVVIEREMEEEDLKIDLWISI